jgi:hypothetical protein
LDEVPISITSRVAPSQRAALEHLLFFNPQQDTHRRHIVDVLDRYGLPEIYAQDDALRVRVGAGRDVQSLYATLPSGRPVGCALFTRESEDSFVVLHLVIEPQYSAQGEHAACNVLLKLLSAGRASARRTRGVRVIELLYGRNLRSRLRV